MNDIEKYFELKESLRNKIGDLVDYFIDDCRDFYFKEYEDFIEFGESLDKEFEYSEELLKSFKFDNYICFLCYVNGEEVTMIFDKEKEVKDE